MEEDRISAAALSTDCKGYTKLIPTYSRVYTADTPLREAN